MSEETEPIEMTRQRIRQATGRLFEGSPTREDIQTLFDSNDLRVIRRLVDATVEEDSVREHIEHFFREHNYEDYVGPPPPAPSIRTAGIPEQRMNTNLFFEQVGTNRDEVNRNLIQASIETFEGQPHLAEHAARFFEDATPGDLQQLMVAPQSISMTRRFMEEAMNRYEGVPEEFQQVFHTGIQSAIRTGAERIAHNLGAPGPIAQQFGVAANIASGYLFNNRNTILSTIAALSAKIRGGFRDHQRMALTLGGLGVAGVYGAARHYLNDAEDFIEEIEEKRQQGIVFGPEEETAIEKLKRYLKDVNTLGNVATNNGQLISVDQTIVKSLMALNDAKSTPERELHIQNLTKLTYVKEYQLAMYDRQLRNKSNISGAPPLLRPGKYGIRPIRITPDWRGAII